MNEPQMTPAEWSVVKAVLAETLALDVEDRARYVATRCGADAGLRREVESLLTSIETATDLYETPALSSGDVLEWLDTSAMDGQSVVGGRIGAYRVLSEIGRGGMGAAYLARRDDDAYQKRVAIKLIKRGMDTDAVLLRFRQERQILANLEHPNIVMLLDGGTTENGLPYFVMEYVDGVPIDAYCDARALTIVERLKLFQAVCGAVQHAHQHRTVHRDLKPNNILVTKNGVPKLLDFGIAKLLDAEHDGRTLDAALLSRVMTPQYSSPEQLRGEPPTAASDVYSLGMLLYVLLSGQLPYRVNDRSDQSAALFDRAPVPPSAAVDEAASRTRGERVEDLRQRLAGSLDAITLTALDRAPDRRYASVHELSQDIQRYLDGLPIAARRERQPALRLFDYRGWIPAVAAATVIAATVLVAAATLVWRRPPPAAIPPEAQSIAVLPLSASDEDPGLEYLSDGLTEDLIMRLARLPSLKVIARDSVYRYRGHPEDTQQIGRELGVDLVLVGRLERQGDSLSIATQLVDTRDPRRVWGDRHQRPVGDVQALQREVAQQIAARIRPRFTAEERRLLTKTRTQNAEAYQSYLRGRYFWNKRTPEGLRRSVDYFREAVGNDPSFALAYVGLADAYGLLTEYHTLPAAETYPAARDAITKALQLDESLAEAHASLAYLRQYYEWNWPGAEQAFRRALTLNPNYSTGRQWYAEFLSASGRHDEALREIRAAIALDPVSLIVNAVEANLLYMAGRYDEAITRSLQVIDMDPNFAEAYEYLKRAYDQKGLYREAIAARQARRRILGRDASETAALAAAQSATTPREYWRQRLAQEIVEARKEGTQPIEFAEIHAQAGNTARALEWLERACAEHDFMMVYARVAPTLQPLRDEPRYLDVLRRGCAM